MQTSSDSFMLNIAILFLLINRLCPLSAGYTEERPIVMASKAENIIRLIGDAKNIDCQYVKDGDDQVTYIGK